MYSENKFILEGIFRKKPTCSKQLMFLLHTHIPTEWNKKADALAKVVDDSYALSFQMLFF